MRRTIVITGASDGVGAAAARKLHQNGHRIIVVGRSPEKTEALAREIGADFLTADFTRLADVTQLAEDLERLCPHIDVLANNAGGVFSVRQTTEDGFEINFQVNYLAPFLLTVLLMDRLIASNASIIQTSSVAARMLGRLDIDRHGRPDDLHGLRAYGTAKLAINLFTRELRRRYCARGISAVAFHPGAVASNFAADSEGMIKCLARSWLARIFMVTPEQGAAQLVWLAESNPGVDWTSGVYYENSKPARRNNPQAADSDLATRLWASSAKLLGIP